MLAGVTLITHGYEPTSSDRPAWLDSMKDAIVARDGADTAVYDIRIARNSNGDAQVMEFDRLSGPSPTGSATSNADTVIMLDWADASGLFFSYFTTSQIAQLVEPYLTSVIPSAGVSSPLAEVPIHLIGHSRGGSVVSALAWYLAQDGIWVDQMTTLDPHPVDSSEVPGTNDAAVNVYDNTVIADNYYELDALTAGEPVAGAHNVNLTGIFPFALNEEHADVHAYYHGTINTTAANDGDSSGPITIDPGWYAYSGTGPRDSVGFAWSRIGDESRPTDGLLGSASRVSVTPSALGADQWDNVFFDTGSIAQNDSITQGEQFDVPTGWVDRNRDATVYVALDNDSSPYDGWVGTMQSYATASVGSIAGTHTVTLDTSSLAPGVYHIAAEIINGTHRRFDYSLSTVTVNPKPSIAITGASVSEGNAGTTSAVFTVSLSAASDQTVTVHWATADGNAIIGSDYGGGNGVLTFDPGQTGYTINVPIVGDTIVEPDETFFVNLSNPTNATIAVRSGLGTILNDDLPNISINNVSSPEGDSGVTAFNFTVSLSQPAYKNVTVDYSTADGTAMVGSDYFATRGTLSFAPGEVSKSIPISVTGDTTIESDETFSVNLSNPTNASIANSVGAATIQNDDDTNPPAVSITPAVGEDNPTASDTIRFSVIFSKLVADFGSASIVLSGTALGQAAQTVTGSGNAYVVDVTGMYANGTVVLTVPAGAVHDFSGRANTDPASGTIMFAGGPSITQAIAPTVVARKGQFKIFAAGALPGSHGKVKKVSVVWDKNGNGIDDDNIIGNAVRSGANWSWTGQAKKLPVGSNLFFVFAQDQSGYYSEDAVVTVTVLNLSPVIAKLAALHKPGSATAKITAVRVRDPDGSIAHVQFYWDANSDGVLDDGDTLLADSKRTTTTILNLQFGQPYTFFARAQDADGAWSNVLSVEFNG